MPLISSTHPLIEPSNLQHGFRAGLTTPFPRLLTGGSSTIIHPATSEPAASTTKPGNGGQTTTPQTHGCTSSSASPVPLPPQDQATSPSLKSTPSYPTFNGRT